MSRTGQPALGQAKLLVKASLREGGADGRVSHCLVFWARELVARAEGLLPWDCGLAFRDGGTVGRPGRCCTRKATVVSTASTAANAPWPPRPAAGGGG